MRIVFLLFATFLLIFEAQAQNIAYLTAKSRMNHGRNLAKAFSKEKRFDVCSENEIPGLLPRLHDYDVVILQLYFEKVDWKELGKALKPWISDGGLLIVSGAEAGGITQNLYGQFGSDWVVDCVGCIMGKDHQKILEFTSGNPPDPVLTFPSDIVNEMSESRGWAHYVKVSPAWTTVVRCPEKHPVLLKRRLGKGTVYSLLSWTPNEMPGKEKLWRDFIQNALTEQSLERTGVKIVKNHCGSSFGKMELYAEFRSGNVFQVSATLTLNGKRLAEKTFQCRGHSKIRLPYKINEGGNLLLNIRVKSAQGETDISSVRPVVLPVTLAAGFHSYRPAILHAAPFRMTLDPGLENVETAFYVDGKKVDKVKFASFPRPCIVNLSGIPAGKHRAQIRIAKEGKEFYRTPETEFTIDAENPPLMVDAEGFLVQNGKRIFPIGFYHQEIGSAAFFRKNGINLVGLSYWRDAEYPSRDVLLQEAVKENLFVILCGFPHMIDSRRGQIPLKNRILEFGDEPDYYGTGPEGVLERTKMLKKMDPQSLTFMCLAKPQSLRGQYNGTTDIVAHDPYPIPNGMISAVYQTLSGLAEQLTGWGRMPMAVPQCFGYPSKPKGWWPRVPRPDEMDNMYFQALAAGVKGLYFYTWNDKGFDIKKYPEIQEAVLRFIRWVRAHEKALLSSDQKALDTGTANLFAREWKTGNTILRIYVNANREAVNHNGSTFAPLEVKIEENGEINTYGKSEKK